MALLLHPAQASADGGAREIVIAAVSSSSAAARPDAARLAETIRAALAVHSSSAVRAGMTFRLVAFDDKCRSDEAAVVAGQVVAVGARFVVGHVCNGAAVAAARVYARHGIPMIALGVRTRDLTAPLIGKNIFRLGPREDRLAGDIVAHLAGAREARRIAVVHDKSAYAHAMADDVAKALESGGMKPLVRESYTAAEPEYNTLVASLVEKGVDAVVLPAQPIEAGIIAARLRAQGSTALIVGGEALGAAAGFEPGGGGEDLDASRVLMLPWPGNVGPAGALAELAHIAVDLWLAALADTPSADTGAVVAALQRVRIATPLGSVAFDASGDAAVRSFIPHVWREGGWRPVVR